MEDIAIIKSGPSQLSPAIARVKGNEVLARELENHRGAIRGIHLVEADAAQGLVSIGYDRRELTSLFSAETERGIFLFIA